MPDTGPSGGEREAVAPTAPTAPTASQVATAPAVSTAPAARAASPRPAPRPGSGQRRRSATPQKDRRKRSTTLSLPYDLRERLKVRAGATGVSQAQIIKDGIEHLYPRLPSLVAEHQAREAAPGEVPVDGLFSRPTAAQERPGQHKVPTGLLMSDVDLDVLDRIVDAVGAESRSQLCWVVLAEYLVES